MRPGGGSVVPFHLRYSLSRSQRLATELQPWVPAVAGSFGFAIGVAVLSVDVSRWFLLLLLLPAILYRGFILLLLDLAFRSAQGIEMRIDDADLELQVDGRRQVLPLSGIIQVFRSGKVWTILHFNGSVLTVPAEAISSEQVDYLQSFARSAAAERRAART